MHARSTLWMVVRGREIAKEARDVDSDMGVSAVGRRGPLWIPPKHLTEWGRPSECLTSQSQWPLVIGLEYGRLILSSLRSLRCLAQEWVRRGSDIILDPGRMYGMHNYKLRVCQCRQYQTALYAHSSTLSTADDCIQPRSMVDRVLGRNTAEKTKGRSGS